MKDEGDFKTILILGMGLMGGSLLKTLRLKCPDLRRIGFDNCCETVNESVNSGIAHIASNNLDDLPIEVCDLIVLATPLGTYQNLMMQLKNRLKMGVTIMDLGSVKAIPGKWIAEAIKGTDATYIGGHPMNGSQKSGLTASSDDLYTNTIFFITNDWNNGPEQAAKLQTVCNWVSKLGAKPVVTDAMTHDAMTAKTSHLPHLTASLLVGGLNERHQAPLEPEQIKQFTAGGFRDTTRIAGSNGLLWTDIFLANKKHLMDEMDEFMGRMKDFKRAIEDEDSEWLMAHLNENAWMRSQLE